MPDHEDAAVTSRRYVLLAAGQSWWNYTVLARRLDALYGENTVLLHGGHSRGPDEVAAAIWRAWGGSALGVRPEWAGPCRTGCPPGHRLPRGLLGTYCPQAGRWRDEEVLDRLIGYRAAGHPVCVLALLTPESHRERRLADRAALSALPLEIVTTPAWEIRSPAAAMEDHES